MNQIINYEGERIKLPIGFKWKIYNYFTPTGTVRPSKDLTFETFDKAIHKGKVFNDFHLFELRRGHEIMIAFCMIAQVKTKKVLPI